VATLLEICGDRRKSGSATYLLFFDRTTRCRTTCRCASTLFAINARAHPFMAPRRLRATASARARAAPVGRIELAARVGRAKFEALLGCVPRRLVAHADSARVRHDLARPEAARERSADGRDALRVRRVTRWKR
jgi:hypothetical protein